MKSRAKKMASSVKTCGSLSSSLGTSREETYSIGLSLMTRLPSNKVASCLLYLEITDKDRMLMLSQFPANRHKQLTGEQFSLIFSDAK